MHPVGPDVQPAITAEEAEVLAAEEAMGPATGYTATLVEYSDPHDPSENIESLSPRPTLAWLIEFSGPCVVHYAAVPPGYTGDTCVDDQVFGVVIDATTGEMIVAGSRPAS
jgi:hypothetical protein